VGFFCNLINTLRAGARDPERRSHGQGEI